jgi:precorrin-6A/cobalt-precorrin-6A reductase
LKPSEIIAMQGPFSYELNKALLIDYRASVLVTKESGPVGGTDNKIKAALDLGIPVILMERPVAAYPIVVSSCAELLEILRSGRRE